jgi:nicotinate-nucleotide adenylyltransferase
MPRVNQHLENEGSIKRLGLMGGTFDPLHYGHLFIAEEARVQCDLEKVLFFPNNIPAHREGKVASADSETRFAWTQEAIAANPCFEMSRVELDRSGPSYAYDTLREMQQLHPGAELFYIVGADSINAILTWHRAEELFDLCRFVAASRPGYDLDIARNILSERQRERVIFLNVPGLHIASRELRERVAGGLPIRYLVPEAVERIVRERGIYLPK